MNIFNAEPVTMMPNPDFVHAEVTPKEPELIAHDASHYLLPDGTTKASVTLPVAGKVDYDPFGKTGPQLINFKDGKEDQARQDGSDAIWDATPAKIKAQDIAAAKEEARIEVEDAAIEAATGEKAAAYKTLRNS